MKLLTIISLFALTSYSSVTYAHARWAEASEGGLTPARSASAGLKVGPCGDIPRENDADRPATVMVSGSDVTLKIFQSIYHKGDYRIYFSEKDDEGLFEFDRSSGTIIQTPSSENTLIGPGELPDQSGQTYYDANITLPNITCDDCVLQLIQYMPDNIRNPYYYSCADIILSTDGSNTGDPVDVTPPEPVSNLDVIAGDAQAILSWTPPVSDFSEVLVLRSDQTVTSELSTEPPSGVAYSVGQVVGDSLVVYKGRASSQTIADLENGNTYYFSVYAVDDNLNYSSGVVQNIELPQISVNVAPLVSLIAEQDTVVSTTFLSDRGEVLVQARVDDGNSTDTHSYDWSLSPAMLIDTDSSGSTFTFDPSIIDAGTYELIVNIQDNGAPPLSALASLEIMIEEANKEVPVVEEPEPSGVIDTNESATSEQGAGIIAPLYIIIFALIAGIKLIGRFSLPFIFSSKNRCY